MSIEPPNQVDLSAQARDAFVLDGRQDGAADHDLPLRIPSSLGAARRRRQTVTSGAQSRETLIEGVETRPDLLGGGHSDGFDRIRHVRHLAVCKLRRSRSDEALDRIQSATSDSTQATALGEMRRCRGNSPRRSRRQMVERDRPVRARTAGKRRNRIDGWWLDVELGADEASVAGAVGMVAMSFLSGARAGVPVGPYM